MDWMLKPYRRYASFSGRAPRIEYWSFVLFVTSVYFVAFALLFAPVFLEIGRWTEGELRVGLLLLFLFNLGSLLPGLAVTVRRLHDTNRSGANILLGFIPVIGAVVLIVFYCQPGTAGDNQYGPDPLRSDVGA